MKDRMGMALPCPLAYFQRKETPMKNMNATQNPQHTTIQTEVKIGKTIFRVTSVYKGAQQLDKVLLDWAADKTLNAS